jgi:tRNA (cytidine/uridine-2'-O-)-methyltransferase
MFNVALLEPEIPQNTGNIARLCAATETNLHIVGVAGFRLDEKAVKRAGLDYWEDVRLFRHRNLEALYEALPSSRFFYLTTKSKVPYYEDVFEDGDCFVFGRETRGLPEELLSQNIEFCRTIPMVNGNVRSLNLANSVSIVLYEGIRQLNLATLAENLK